MSTIFVNEAFNIKVGKDDADNDKRKRVTNLSIPDLEELTASTTPAAPVSRRRSTSAA